MRDCFFFFWRDFFFFSGATLFFLGATFFSLAPLFSFISHLLSAFRFIAGSNHLLLSRTAAESPNDLKKAITLFSL